MKHAYLFASLKKVIHHETMSFPPPLLSSCQHSNPSPTYVAAYCFILSTAFVGGLYVVPKDIRRLPRDDERQIKWRMLLVLVTCLISTLLYPALFCIDGDGGEDRWKSNSIIHNSSTSALRYLGWSWGARRDVAVLLHVMTLYLGPIITALARLHLAKTHFVGAFSCTPRKQPIGYFQAFREIVIKPTISFFRETGPSSKWAKARDLIVAPLAEEVAFRGCMVVPLLKSGLSPVAVAWTAPLFFGTAHLHHAMLKIRGGVDAKSVLIMTVFQFAYTTLFGAYVAHAFIRTGSLPAVFLCHSFCNYMGLPDFGYLDKASPVYGYRRLISNGYLFGVLLFYYGFTYWEGGNIVQRLCYFPSGSALPAL